jgi:IclR family pca regulon transcriptional regulator
MGSSVPSARSSDGLSRTLDQYNQSRKAIEAEMIEQARSLAMPRLSADEPAIVVFLEDGHPGVQGIVASRLVQAFGRPALVLTPAAAPGMLTGSGRSIEGLHLRDALQRIVELAPKVLQLGYSFLSANNYHSVIQQVLEAITAECGESSSLGVLDGDEVIYVARSSSRQRLMAITLSVGTRLPAAHTSMGRILLAQLPDAELDAYLERVELERHTDRAITDKSELKERILEARRQGYAIVDQELDAGLRSIAVSAFDTNGRLLGAINISTNAARVDFDTLTQEYLPLLQEKAGEIRANIG